MDEFKDQIKDLYKAFSDKQKNTKGTPHKFDSIGNFRGKLGVNDTGIPLTPKAYKKKERNRRDQITSIKRQRDGPRTMLLTSKR